MQRQLKGMNMLAVVGLATSLCLASGAVAMAAQSQTLKGEVARLDAPAKTLVVKETAKTGMPREMTFTLGGGATIVDGSKTVSLSNIKVGDTVTVTYTQSGSEALAQRIEMGRPKMAKASGGTHAPGRPY